MASKRFYWIKLKQSFYESNDAIDFLMSQSDGHGAQYVVLYQMLCLKTANNGGGLYSQLGEMIVPYDIDKIVRDCKYFERYIVTQALQLYKSLGLVYEQKDCGYLVISDIENMIGSESDSAERVRKHRNSAKSLHCNASGNGTVTRAVTAEIDIEIDKEISLARDKESPTLEHITAYCRERKNNVDPQRFFDYYSATGWMVGGQPMRDWKAMVRRWETNGLDNIKAADSAPQRVTYHTPAELVAAASANFIQITEDD